jgi:hypothetical protein
MKFKFLIGLFALLTCSASVSAAPNFTAESGVQLSTSNPFAVVSATSTFRLYFTRDGFEILSATSTDGFSWREESGVRIDANTVPSLNIFGSTITGAAVLPLDAGGYRMLYSISVSTSAWRIYSATSTDGVAWANEVTPIFTSSTGFVGGPQLIERSNGDWQVYFLRDSNGGDDVRDRQVYSSLSTNQGMTWTAPALALASDASSIAAVIRSDRLVRLYLSQPLASSSSSTVIVSALAADALGTSFNLEAGPRFALDANTGALGNSTVFHSTDSVQWRMLYGYRASNSAVTNILAATTLNPDPQSLAPSQIVRSDPSAQLTIFGEVFDATPTVKLTHGSDPEIPGTGLVRHSDLSMAATFETNGKPLGYWNLVVTNSDGHSATLANALLISFLSGDVVLTDNLLRPRNGARTRIDIDIFDGGEVAVYVYSLDGRLVNTLYRAQTAPGKLTLYWNGKTAEGNEVASGVYFVKVTGPKLNTKEKVVVIR